MNKYTLYRKININLEEIIQDVPVSLFTHSYAEKRVRKVLIQTYQALRDADNDKFFKKK